MKALFKWGMRFFAQDYWNGWIYVFEPEQAGPPAGEVTCAALDTTQMPPFQHQEPNTQARPLEADAWAFGAWINGELAAVCWFHARETYRRHGGLFDLKVDEAELVQITTEPEFRRRRVATALIEYAAWQMGKNGFRKLYAKIWHNNIPSIRAFERAGWKLKARFFSFRLRRLKSPLVLRFRPRPAV